MDSGAGFGKSELFLTDARLVFGVLNHVRYQALNRVFGVSREQANVVTAIVLLGAADGAYEAARRIAGIRPHMSGSDAALGAITLRDVSLGIAGPNVRAIPGFWDARGVRDRRRLRRPRPAAGGPQGARRRAAAPCRRGADPPRAHQALRGRARPGEHKRGVTGPHVHHAAG